MITSTTLATIHDFRVSTDENVDCSMKFAPSAAAATARDWTQL
jgi:hypothetical protein